jgi:hypothetical protein
MLSETRGAHGIDPRSGVIPPIRWSWRRVVVVFLAVFWLIPFVAAIISSGFIGDCGWESDECSTLESFSFVLVLAVSAFWIFVAAPVTAVVGVAWIVWKVAGFIRQSAIDYQEAGWSLSTQDIGRNSGVREGYIWLLAGALWSISFMAIISLTSGSASYAALAAAFFAAIMAAPLTAILAATWLARRFSA